MKFILTILILIAAIVTAITFSIQLKLSEDLEQVYLQQVCSDIPTFRKNLQQHALDIPSHKKPDDIQAQSIQEIIEIKCLNNPDLYDKP